ncbi:hypothetical protein [Kosakonia sp. LAM2021]|uniref:restriction endonuclease n=1 Tax=Kosakonia sp. LAM2021 TaxID=2800475 RepID=UPI00190C0926|nr:hypothetical protein [Kosakonia sp. LAM2021]
MAKNTGKAYEEFVRTIQQSLITAEGMSHLKNIEVETNKKLTDRNGIERQFDVYWEFDLGGYVYKTVIECKDYASSITVEKIDAFIGKTADIPGLRLIYATKTGYQSGASIKAEQHKIDLLIVREADEREWTAEDGTPLIKTIQLNIVALTSPRITSFAPNVDTDWLEKQKDLNADIINHAFTSSLNNEIFISNESTGHKFSLFDLSHLLLKKIPDIQYGKGTFSEELDNSYLETKAGDIKIKIKGYKLDYEYHAPITTSSVIDYSKDLLGIVEKYNTGTKQMIFKDGKIK